MKTTLTESPHRGIRFVGRKSCESDDKRCVRQPVLDFDHLDPTTKKKEISNLVFNTAGLATIQSEIDKCEVVCSNCHRRRTAKRRG